MKIKEDWEDNKGLKIHYIDSEVKNTNKTPLLICPGLSDKLAVKLEITNKKLLSEKLKSETFNSNLFIRKCRKWSY